MRIRSTSALCLEESTALAGGLASTGMSGLEKSVDPDCSGSCRSKNRNSHRSPRGGLRLTKRVSDVSLVPNTLMANFLILVIRCCDGGDATLQCSQPVQG